MNDVQTNHQIAQQVSDGVWGAGNIRLIDELYSASYVDLNPTPGVPATRDGLKMLVQMYHDAFPDLQIHTDELLVTEDKIVMRYTASGTHEGEMMGMPPTGKSATISGISILHVQEGQITAEFTLMDNMGLMQQLGLAPAVA